MVFVTSTGSFSFVFRLPLHGLHGLPGPVLGEQPELVVPRLGPGVGLLLHPDVEGEDPHPGRHHSAGSREQLRDVAVAGTVKTNKFTEREGNVQVSPGVGEIQGYICIFIVHLDLCHRSIRERRCCGLGTIKRVRGFHSGHIALAAVEIEIAGKYHCLCLYR